MSGSVVFYILANSSPNCFAFEYYFYIWYLYILSDWLKSLRLLVQLVRRNRRYSTGGGFEPPPGRIYPACGKKNPLAVLPLSLAVRHGSWATEPGPCGYGPAQWATEPGPWRLRTGPGPRCRQSKPGSRLSGVFSAGVNWPLLNWKPWGRSFPRRSSFLAWNYRGYIRGECHL